MKYGKTLAVDSLDLEVKNETVVLFGPSGCGKTTILKAILGVTEPGMRVDGYVLLNGQPIPKDEGIVGMVFQGPVVPPWMTVYNLCRMGSKVRRLRKREQRKRVEGILERFEIGHFADRYPYQLSGGQKQRVALAVTLLNEPRVLLLDEPSTFIDGMTRISIWSFIERTIKPLGMPTVIVSHDPIEALVLGDKVCRMSSPARVVEEIAIPFGHPRSDEVYQAPAFWELRGKLGKNLPSVG